MSSTPKPLIDAGMRQQRAIVVLWLDDNRIGAGGIGHDAYVIAEKLCRSP